MKYELLVIWEILDDFIFPSVSIAAIIVCGIATLVKVINYLS